MCSIIDYISNDSIWKEYLNFKKNQASMTKREIIEIEEYVEKKEYKNIAEAIKNGNYEFSAPQKHLINKINKSKKRVVYSFEKDENMILKIITYLFSKKYDEKYSNNCYSFRKQYCVKDAIKNFSKTKNIDSLYGYKIDIENYFNSADVGILLEKLKEFLDEDLKLFRFLEKILTDDRVQYENNVIHECKGMIAGAPISSFLANIYLQEVDEYFMKEGVLYARYSDDIIFFADKDSINKYIIKLEELIKKNRLKLNNEKLYFIKPNEKWEFLGFSYEKGIIDISDVAKKKIKGKIRRLSRKLRRWMVRKNATSERAIAAVIRKMNKKFYTIEQENELTWQYWYFPIINTSKRNSRS